MSNLFCAKFENEQKERRTDSESILPDNLFPVICLPVRSPRIHRGACGVVPLSTESSIAAMSAMRVDAHRAERQVHQPGLVPLSRTASEYHENSDIATPSRLSSRPSTSLSSRYMTADVEQIQSNKPNQMEPISYRPVHLPVLRVGRRGGTEPDGASVDTGGRAADTDGWQVE